MNSDMTGNSEREQRLDAIVTAYLKAVEAGEHPGPQEWLDRYPELADELSGFFAGQQLVAKMAEPPLPEGRHPRTETIGLEGRQGKTILDTVRYFGDYELLEEIARGGMGVVYKARQPSLNRVVALKMILKGELATIQDVQRFHQEAEAAGNLDHPHIVPIYEVGEHNGQHYFSMKFIEGGSLAQKMAEFLPNQKMAARLLATVARGVHYAHQRGVLHRDLKPANILLDQQGQPHITDFGLAKRVGGDRGQTQSGAIVGTPSYMAPEQASAKKDLSIAVDVYSLGAIFYELLTGKPPFRAETPLETLLRVVEREPEKPHSDRQDIDADLGTICLKCLEKDPRRRYDSALALAEDLERWLDGEPIHARAVSSVERLWRWCRRKPAVASLLAALLLMMMTVVAVSSVLGMQARRMADEEKKAREAAGISEGRAKQNEEQALQQEKLGRLEKERADRQLSLAELRLYAGQLAQAQREWQDGNGGRALQILDGCQWDLRDVEYRLLWTLYTSNQLTLGDQRTLTCVAFSPDGKRIVSGHGYGIAKVWDAGNGKEVLTLQGGGPVAYSPDSKRIVSGGKDSTIKVWDAENGQELLSLAGQKAVMSVAFSPDGNRIVSGGEDRSLKVWDAEKGQKLLSLAGHTAAVTSVAFSPDSKRIVSGSVDCTVKVWDARTGQEVRTLKGHTQPVRGAAVSPDGVQIISASEDSTLKVWNLRTGEEVLILKGHMREVTCVAISPDGRRIVSGSLDKTVKMWDAHKGQQGLALKGHTGPVRSVAFSPGSMHLVSGGGGYDRGGNALPGTLMVWNVVNGREVRTLKGHTAPVLSAAFSPDGRRIVSGSEDGTLKVWDAVNGRERRTMKGAPLGVRSVAFGPDSYRIVSEGEFGTQVWEANTGQVALSMKGGHEMAVCSVAFSPDGKRIVTASLDWTLKVWDAENGKEVRTLKGHTFSVYCVTFSPDGKRIVSGSRDNTLKVWDAETGEDLLTLRGHTKPVHSVAFSPDGKRILSGSEDDTLKVWDAVTGQSLLTLKEPRGGVSSVAISPNGNRIVTGSEDGTLKVWDAWNSQVVRSLEEDDLVAISIAFSPDGKRLVAGYLRGTVKGWDAVKGQVVLSLKGLTEDVRSVAFSPDGKRISAKEKNETREKVLTWDATTGQVLPDAKPAVLEEQVADEDITSPDGSLRARLNDDGKIKVVRLSGSIKAGKRQQAEDRAFLERLARPDPEYHRQKAALSEKSRDLFAAAFHLRRLLAIEPKEGVRQRLAVIEAAAKAEVPLPEKMPHAE